MPDERLTTLVTRLIADAKEYGRAEVAYAQSLAHERAGDAKHGAGMLAVAGVLSVAALTTLLVGLVLALIPLVGAVLATAIVVGASCLVAALLARAGISKLRSAARKNEREAGA